MTSPHPQATIPNKTSRPRKEAKFVLRCEEGRFLLECGNAKPSQEFSTLLNALVFANNNSREGEAPLTVLDAQGRLIDKSMVGRRTW